MKRIALLLAALALAAAGAVLLWPLHATGVSGNALRPSYSDFGWFAYAPMPEHPTTDDLRAGGVRVPQDVVSERRRIALGLGVVGLVLAGAGAGASGRRQRTLSSD